MAVTTRVSLYPNGGVINFSGSPSTETVIQIRGTPPIAPNPNEEFTGTTGSGWHTQTHTDITFTRDGYVFSEWNSSADGTGTSFAIGDTFPTTIATVYAIWAEAQQPSYVSVSLGNTEIATINDSGTEVLETNGTYLTDDITVDFTQGGNASVTVSLGDETIATMLTSSTEVFETNGTFLTNDITIALS